MVESEERVVRKEIKIEIPAGLELSEEEMNKVVSATQDQLVDVIRGTQAKQLAAKVKEVTEVARVKVNTKYEMA